MRPPSTIRRLALAGLAAALIAAPAATAGTPTPPTGVREQIADPVFLLSLPADGGAWTLWSGTLDGDVWWMLSSPRARKIAGAGCPRKPPALTVCFNGEVAPGRTVVVGRVKPRAATVTAVDQAGRKLRLARRGGAYLAVARGRPKTVTVVARDRSGDVVARRFFDYRRRP